MNRISFAAFATVLLTRNLMIGSVGEDVMLLQQILNYDPATRVAESGDGAPGFETSYFGAKTQAAVMRYQEAHRAEVLVPAGLTAPNGFVGPLTRASLEATFFAEPVTPPEEDEDNKNDEKDEENEEDEPVVASTTEGYTAGGLPNGINGLRVDSIKSNVVIGQPITITGDGFTATNNTVVTLFGSFKGLTSPDRRSLTFTIARNPYLLVDEYTETKSYMMIENGLGQIAYLDDVTFVRTK